MNVKNCTHNAQNSQSNIQKSNSIEPNLTKSVDLIAELNPWIEFD